MITNDLKTAKGGQYQLAIGARGYTQRRCDKYHGNSDPNRNSSETQQSIGNKHNKTLKNGTSSYWKRKKPTLSVIINWHWKNKGTQEEPAVSYQNLVRNYLSSINLIFGMIVILDKLRKMEAATALHGVVRRVHYNTPKSTWVLQL